VFEIGVCQLLQSSDGPVDNSGRLKLTFTSFLEILDAGYPQTTDASTLKLFITTATLPTRNLDSQSSSEASKVSIQATGAIAWRRPDIKYRKNEAFCDVVESVNYLGSVNGSVLRADVAGQVLMRAYLTGMPECKFGMNDRVMDASAGKKREDGTVLLDDVQFHQCVKLGRFESDRTISFVPPDGEFELMKWVSGPLMS
jgi:AP-2 complex subunit mu-1